MSQKKLTPQSGQKGLKSYLQPKGKPGFGCPLSTSTPKQDNSIVKKRTPPSIENPARKRKTSSSSSSSEDKSFNQVPIKKKLPMDEVTEPKDEFNQLDAKEDRDRLHKNKVYSQFTPEIIECL